ncbi:MAG: ABC transporter substrate-binding protein [Burkholderiaceae bacterium]|nr:ABC transporter substrate-binding protein [Burkholderiaceae bacterium]
MRSRFFQFFSVMLAVCGAIAAGQANAETFSCPVKIGITLPLTGSLAPIARAMADGAQLAVEHVNAGGGVKGCKVQLITRDDQNQPNVGVDAAKYLVDVERVSVLSGGLASGVALPILTTVAVPGRIPYVACCATAATFTTLSEEGKTDGFFFHLMASVKTQAAGAAKAAIDQGYRRVGMIYMNTDLGTGMVSNFRKIMESMGGEVPVAVPYNENQTSYRAEINKVLSAKPDAVFFVAFVQDGATMTREWLSFGGTQNILLHNGLRSIEYVNAVGSKYLRKAIGFDNAAATGDTVDAFLASYKEKFGRDGSGPGIAPQYDAIIVAALAMNIASDLSGASIRDSIRKVQVKDGAVVGTGPDEYRKALGLIGKGEAIRYLGATGPVEFDANGDVAGPILIWNVTDNGLGVVRGYSQEEISNLLRKVQ